MNFKDVLGEELTELGRRRALRDGSSDASDIDGAPPAASEALVGLCFSGGGIRSATFNLGIARGLHRWGLLDHVDYLSTVSGGGYIGSYLANLCRQGRELEVLDSGTEGMRTEPPGVKQLRGLGRFLTPTGSLGEWLQAFAALVRGTLWNCAFFTLAALALGAVFSLLLDDQGQWAFFGLFSPDSPFPHGLASGLALGLALAVLMGSVFRREETPRWLLVTLLAGVVLVGAMDVLPWTLDAVEGHAAWLEVTALSSAVAAIVGSGILSRLPLSLYVLVARLLAFLVAVLIPVVLCLRALLYFIAPTNLPSDGPSILAIQLGSVALLLVFLVVDFNRTSLHGYYAARMAATFLDDAPPRLSAFVAKPGPLHLVNVALNVGAELDPSLRDRRADFFTLSCLHVGGPRTGYVDTEEFEAAQPHFTLANAVAVSGAAAAPNMGSFTDALIRPLMTILNVRMGYWAPNPAFVRERSWWNPGLLPYLFKEMAGSTRSDEKLVNLSDGGHLENLGAFELLRRRCKLIIVGDGEADPALSFGAMSALIRFAQVELDTMLDIDLDDLRPNEAGFSTKHAALGTVHYPDGSVGRMLYLKSSLTGHEAPDVRYYKDQNPDFPHESTADQWFDDAQFDAYRCLGEEVVDSLFQGLGYASPAELDLSTDRVPELLASLAVVLAPSSRSRSGQLTLQLDELQKALMHEAFAAYRSQLLPTIHAASIPDDALHSLTPIVMLQLQLMENAVEHLGLLELRNREALANRGWMNEFRRWAQSEAFARLALVCLPSFGANLSEFVASALHLASRYEWAPFPARPQTLALVESTPAGASMVTGLAEYRIDDEGTVRVHRLALRNGFGGRDRLEQAASALREHYQGQSMRFVEDAAALTRGLPADAYVLRPPTRPWTEEDEATVLAFTREQTAMSDSEPAKQDEASSGAPPRDMFANMMAFEVPRGGGDDSEQA